MWSLPRRGRSAFAKAALLFLLLGGGLPQALWGATQPLNLWPLFDQRQDPLDGSEEVTLFGPLFSFRRGDGVREIAFHPFFHLTADQREQAVQWEFLYPVSTYERVEEDRSFQFIQLLRFREEGEPWEREERFDLFPLYFSGRTADGRTYRAFFPFYGTILDRLGFDEIRFILFPLHIRLKKVDREARYYVWPVFALIEGERIHGFRLFPLYGQEVKEGIYERRFALWPLFLQQRWDLETDDPKMITALLPLYVAQRSKEREFTTILWPFFTSLVDRKKGYTEWNLPWPLVVVSKGKDRDILRLLPFYADERRRIEKLPIAGEGRVRNFALLYPLYTRSEEEFPGSRLTRDRIVWWMYSDLREEDVEGSERRLDVWPLFTYRSDRGGRVSFHALSLLEPILPGNEKLERSYASLWRLFSHRRDPEKGVVTSFLWNLLRWERGEGFRSFEFGPIFAFRERDGEEKTLSLLAGLVQYRSEPQGSSLRLFYLLRLPLSKKRGSSHVR